MHLSFDFAGILSSPIALALIAAAIVVSIWLICVYRKIITRVVKKARHCDSIIAADVRQSLPQVSIIVYNLESSNALASLLPTLLSQNYPADFEVIVTTDGCSEIAGDIVGALSSEHRNLRLTYVPDEAHSLSRKKLAITLGVKAARYPYVVLTDANAQISSSDWLSVVCREFTNGADIVAGHSYFTPRQSAEGERHSKPLRGITAFDALASCVTATSSTIAAKPFRANDCNLAFRRQIFIDVKGFADSVGYHHGIDDIFFARIAKGHMTCVELSKLSFAPVASSNPTKAYKLQRERHIFTGRKVGHTSRRLMGFSSLMMWIWVLTIAGSTAYFLLHDYEIIPLAINLLAGIVWMITCSIAWTKASRALAMNLTQSWLMPIWMLMRPLNTLIYRLKAQGMRASNYTWSKPV